MANTWASIIVGANAANPATVFGHLNPCFEKNDNFYVKLRIFVKGNPGLSVDQYVCMLAPCMQIISANSDFGEIFCRVTDADLRGYNGQINTDGDDNANYTTDTICTKIIYMLFKKMDWLKYLDDETIDMFCDDVRYKEQTELVAYLKANGLTESDSAWLNDSGSDSD
jgi:hypothetical protein